MSSLKLLHSGGNGVIISAPSSNPAANRTITLNDNYAGDGSFVTANSSGNVGIGTASPDQILHLNKTSGDTYLRLQGGTNQGTLIHATDGTLLGGFVSGGAVGGGTSDMAMRVESGNNMLFAHGTTERMRILANGSITTNGNTSLPTGSTNGFGFSSDQFYLSYDGTGPNYSQRFYNNNGLVGSILVNGSGTGYNTSSDYRLKENASAISDGITRLKELKPYKFNFKADKSKTLDGFFAHETQAVVPESATGVKDEVDSDNKPVYQGIDQSKLVPLLTAALQEAVAKIETLETKVAALEGA